MTHTTFILINDMNLTMFNIFIGLCNTPLHFHPTTCNCRMQLLKLESSVYPDQLVSGSTLFSIGICV